MKIAVSVVGGCVSSVCVELGAWEEEGVASGSVVNRKPVETEIAIREFRCSNKFQGGDSKEMVRIQDAYAPPALFSFKLT